MTDIQLTLIVIGLVAIARRQVPRIDGALVAVAAIAVAMVTAVLATPCDLGADLCRGLIGGLSAFGVMTAVRYATRKLDCLCKGASDDAPNTPSASEEA